MHLKYPYICNTGSVGTSAASSSNGKGGVEDKENDRRLSNGTKAANGIGGISPVSSSRPSRLATLLSEAK